MREPSEIAMATAVKMTEKWVIGQPAPDTTTEIAQFIQGAIDARLTWVHAAKETPKGDPDCWSKKVLVYMKSGKVDRLSYFNPRDGNGLWQRRPGTEEGDAPLFWMPFPEL